LDKLLNHNNAKNVKSKDSHCNSNAHSAKQKSVHFLSKSNEWATPEKLFDRLNREFHFTLDSCATVKNAKCIKYFTIFEDGLKQDWSSDIVFMNPPYGREIGKWIEKAYRESLNGAIVICLIPARTDTTYWHDYIFGKAEVRFLRSRIKFGDGKNSAPFPSAIVIFRGCGYAG